MFKREVPEVRATHEMVGVPAAAMPSEDAAAALAEAAAKEAEKEKLRKVLKLLEKEYKEGIISDKAYDDLRKRNEEKLRNLGG
jgi:hypothetical protein